MKNFLAHRNTRLIVLIFGGLLVYAVTLVVLTGDIWFWGDDWFVFAPAYWYRPLNAYYSFAENTQRPLQGVYWITFFELFGANSILAQIGSLLIHACNAILWAAAILIAFPAQRRLASAVALFSFFMPVFAGSTYMMLMENTRLQMLFFLLSLLAYQLWVLRGRLRWCALIFPIALYNIGTLTYEAGVLMILAVPPLLYPVWQRYKNTENRHSDFDFWLRVFTGMGASVLIFLIVQIGLLSSVSSRRSRWIPKPDDFLAYITQAVDSLIMPFQHLPSDAATWIIGLAVMLAAGVILLRRASNSEDENGSHSTSTLYLFGVGLLIFVQGGIPYFLTDVAIENTFTLPNRIYSTGLFGIAILLALLTRFKTAGSIISAILIGVFAMAHAGARHDWQDAAKMRESLFASLIEQAPGVEPGTTFLFLDLQHKTGVASVVEGVNGTQDYIRILYDDTSLRSHFMYLRTDDFENTEDQEAVILSDGVVARGGWSGDPAPFDSLLIFVREGDHLLLLDTLAADDTFNDVPAAVLWDENIRAIHSNPERIKSATLEELAHREQFIGR